MRATPARRGERRRAGDERHVGARLGGRLREREAHLARARVGDAAHRVDRLERRAGGDQHALAGEDLRLRAGAIAAAKISSASSMRPSPTSPQAWSPLPGPSTATPSAASCATLRCVAALLHICRFIAGATSSGQSRARQSVDEQVVGAAVRELREEIGGRRRDDDDVGAARELDVVHGVVAPEAHRSVSTGRPDSAWNVIGVDEARRGVGHHDVDGDAGLDEQARELGGLVRGDAAGHAEHDAGERGRAAGGKAGR